MLSPKESSFYLIKGYPGLEGMAEYIVKYFPQNIERYVEPFAGLGRTAKLVNAKEMILNDMSDYAVEYLTKHFLNALVTKEDFRDCIKKWDSESTFFLIDPPWRKNIYKNNELPYCNMTPIQYYENVLYLLRNLKGKWILCVDRDEHEIGKRVSKSGYPNLVLQHPTKKLYGKSIAVRMCSDRTFILP